MRTNAGYRIIEATPINDNEEIVIGYMEEIKEYVCWWYRKDNGDYFWGDYSRDYEIVKKSYNERILKNRGRY